MEKSIMHPTTQAHTFEDKVIVSGMNAKFIIPEKPLQKIEDMNLSQYEILADLCLASDQVLDLKNGDAFAIVNPFMDTSIVATIQAEDGMLYYEVIDVLNHVPYGHVRKDGTQGYRFGGIKQVVSV